MLPLHEQQLLVTIMCSGTSNTLVRDHHVRFWMHDFHLWFIVLLELLLKWRVNIGIFPPLLLDTVTGWSFKQTGKMTQTHHWRRSFWIWSQILIRLSLYNLQFIFSHTHTHLSRCWVWPQQACRVVPTNSSTSGLSSCKLPCRQATTDSARDTTVWLSVWLTDRVTDRVTVSSVLKGRSVSWKGNETVVYSAVCVCVRTCGAASDKRCRAD